MQVQSAQDLGTVGRPPSVVNRDIGCTAKNGNGQILWAFGDTLTNPQPSDGLVRSCTAALAAPASPLVTSEPVDGNGVPYQFLPFTDTERQWNLANPSDRISIFADGLWSPGNGTNACLYGKWKNPGGGLGYVSQGVGTASIANGATVATRDPMDLFPMDDPAIAVMGLVFRSGQLPWAGYLYACATKQRPGTVDFDVYVARVALGSWKDRAAWRFWNGTWMRDVTKASPVTVGGAVLSLSWNAYVQQFLMVYAQGFGGQVVARTANRPQGAWGAPVPLLATMAPPSGASMWCYGGLEHGELAAGSQLLVTYCRPLLGLELEIRAVRVTLA